MKISQEFLFNRKDNNASFYLYSMIWDMEMSGHVFVYNKFAK